MEKEKKAPREAPNRGGLDDVGEEVIHLCFIQPVQHSACLQVMPRRNKNPRSAVESTNELVSCTRRHLDERPQIQSKDEDHPDTRVRDQTGISPAGGFGARLVILRYGMFPLRT